MKDSRKGGLEPSQFLVENVGLLPGGRVLDVAMGSGRNAIYLARVGFEVEGVDVSSEALSSAVESAREAGVNIRVDVADLEGDFHIKEAAYDVIICFNYLQRSLIPQIKDGLRLGGIVVYETFIIDQAKIGRPKNRNHLLEYNELLDMFRDFRCLRYREGIVQDGTAVASLVAQKVAAR